MGFDPGEYDFEDARLDVFLDLDEELLFFLRNLLGGCFKLEPCNEIAEEVGWRVKEAVGGEEYLRVHGFYMNRYYSVYEFINKP